MTRGVSAPALQAVAARGQPAPDLGLAVVGGVVSRAVPEGCQPRQEDPAPTCHCAHSPVSPPPPDPPASWPRESSPEPPSGALQPQPPRLPSLPGGGSCGTAPTRRRFVCVHSWGPRPRLRARCPPRPVPPGPSRSACPLHLPLPPPRACAPPPPPGPTAPAQPRGTRALIGPQSPWSFSANLRDAFFVFTSSVLTRTPCVWAISHVVGRSLFSSEGSA